MQRGAGILVGAFDYRYSLKLLIFQTSTILNTGFCQVSTFWDSRFREAATPCGKGLLNLYGFSERSARRPIA
jgi:hypothetical protein